MEKIHSTHNSKISNMINFVGSFFFPKRKQFKRQVFIYLTKNVMISYLRFIYKGTQRFNSEVGINNLKQNLKLKVGMRRYFQEM